MLLIVWVVVCEIIRKVCAARLPKSMGLSLVYLVITNERSCQLLFGCFWLPWIVSNYYAVELSYCIGVACWGWSISSRVVLMGTSSWVVWNSVSALTPDSRAITFFMTMEGMRMVPLISHVLSHILDSK